MRGKSLSLLIGFIMGTALAGTAQKPPERRYFKASNPSLEKQGLPVPYSDAVLVGNTMYVSGRTGIDPQAALYRRTHSRRLSSFLTVSRQHWPKVD